MHMSLAIVKKHCKGCSENDKHCQIRGYLRLIKQYELISECPCGVCLVKLRDCHSGCEDYTNFVVRCSSDIKTLNNVEMAKLLVDIFNNEWKL
jgi:hypothetical protein